MKDVTIIQSIEDKTIKMRVASSQNTGGNGERYFEMKDKAIQVVVEKYNSDLLVQDMQIKLLAFKITKNRYQQFKKVQQIKNEDLGTKTQKYLIYYILKTNDGQLLFLNESKKFTFSIKNTILLGQKLRASLFLINII
ncbi:unnamed protein product [Paramecium pentaurelia]|uniref:Uncharacterized protein n=1 Tax=Paramecium pentaurelia TaxID=43138 RepID=A0A8S1X117_9CILI|nr:unnamed protein product [Paramecium pentaurelia]